MYRGVCLLEALELLRLRAQTLVIERLHALFERINLFYLRIRPDSVCASRTLTFSG